MPVLIVLPFLLASLVAAPPPTRTLHSLFAEQGRVEVTESGMTIVDAPQHHVLVARVSDDGSLSTACAVTEEAVEALLVAPPAAVQQVSKDK